MSNALKKKEILAEALKEFLINLKFPDYKKFRLKFEYDWALLEELLADGCFNNNERSYYILTIKGLSFIDNNDSRDIIHTVNKLIPILKDFYRRDPSDNKMWLAEEIAQAADCTKFDVQVALFFMQDMWFLGGHQPDVNNKNIFIKIMLREEVLLRSTVEDFILETENKKIKRNKIKEGITTTVILGAGMGIEYGYPDGPKLKELIAKELPDDQNELKKIKDILYWTPAETVDEIAARHPEHANLLREIVVKILSECEDEEKLGRHQNNTYKLLLKQIGLAKSKGNSINVLTFNYDRSLQWMINKVNEIEPQERRIDPSIIIPIYGRLAPLHFEDEQLYRKSLAMYWRSIPMPSFYIYGGVPCPQNTNPEYWKKKRVEEMVKDSKLKFIGEVKEHKDEKIRKILDDSDQIFFLGCGYHQANFDVLGFDFKSKYSNKLIVGTGFGLSKVDIEAIQLANQAVDYIEEGCDAYTFLKRKFDISDPAKNTFTKPYLTFD